MNDRVELQTEVDAPRELIYPLLGTAEGLATWLDSAELEARVGAPVRLRLRDGVATGKVLAVDEPQHISFTWDWQMEPLGRPSVVAFDAIDHGSRTHVTIRQVGLSPEQVEIHQEMWRHWLKRFRAAAQAAAKKAAAHS